MIIYERRTVDPTPCCVCDDPACEWSRPGYEGWQASDTNHPGVQCIAETQEKAREGLLEALEKLRRR